MARQLWLLRHADAEPHGSREDSQRRLTERGERQARTAGLALARLGLGFEAILFSPKVRARQTAELAAEAWDEAERSRLSVLQALASGFDGVQALDAMAGVGDEGRLMLVGHEPDLSNVVAQLTGGRIDLKKGGLAVLRLDGAGGELSALMRPRELALIAEEGLRALGVPVGGE